MADQETDMTRDRTRFDLSAYPLPKHAQGKTFFDKSPGYLRTKRAFCQLVEDPGLGVLTAEAGVGKTAAFRNLCAELPRPDHLVLYLCDTAVSPLDLYRTLASELGVQPSHRRGQLWTDIKKALVHLVDERGTAPLVVLDEAQHLSDRFLLDLGGFLNFAFDSRDLLTLWLVGLPPLARRLHMQQHAALRSRIAVELRLEPLDRDVFGAAIEHAFKAAGASQKLLADQAMEMLFRGSRGVLRTASRTLRTALRIAAERGQSFLDEATVQAALDELGGGT
jgi:type II secretory pathway predicted ATPase ExeA